MDLALRNATIIDGTGRDRFRGDVGVGDGRIIAVGAVDGRAKEEIDVAGAVVAPGFIDCHTHYDAQVAWDPMLSPSVYHGVTTVLAGHCCACAARAQLAAKRRQIHLAIESPPGEC